MTNQIDSVRAVTALIETNGLQPILDATAIYCRQAAKAAANRNDRSAYNRWTRRAVAIEYAAVVFKK